MTSPLELSMGDDDLARQRRKRDARLLDQEVAGFPGVTLAEVVADVLAAGHGGQVDVTGYLEARGHGWQTIEAVLRYLHRQDKPDTSDQQQLRLL